MLSVLFDVKTEAHRLHSLPRAHWGKPAQGRSPPFLTRGQVSHGRPWWTASFFGLSLTYHPRKSRCAHLLPWRRIPSSCHTVPRAGWTGPSVAGFLQVQVWFLNIAASALRESEQLPLEGLLAALQVPRPHPRTTGGGALGARKEG